MRHIKHLYKDKDFIQNSILIILAVIAAFLGFLIYKKHHVSAPSAQLPSQEVPAGMPPQVDSGAFTPDEQKLLKTPAEGAPQSEIDAHAQLAAKLAVIGTTIEVKDCKATPLVLQTKLGSAVTFKNTSDYKISINFDSNNIVDINAGKSVSTSKAFVHGPGVYGYLCEGNGFTGLIGFVLITP